MADVYGTSPPLEVHDVVASSMGSEKITTMVGFTTTLMAPAAGECDTTVGNVLSGAFELVNNLDDPSSPITLPVMSDTPRTTSSKLSPFIDSWVASRTVISLARSVAPAIGYGSPGAALLPCAMGVPDSVSV